MKKVFNRGFSLVEILIVVGILGILFVIISAFQTNVWRENIAEQSALEAEGELRRTIQQFMHDVRGSAPSNTGSYPVELASTTALTLYGDSDGDADRERIRYFISGATLVRGITNPSGTPASYSDSNENKKTMVHYLAVSSTRFEYFDGAYMGTSSPLAQPVDNYRVRLIRLTVTVDKDSSRSPLPLTMTGQSLIRSLKDNF